MEAIQVEGHTDDQDLSAALRRDTGLEDNLDLAGRRAGATYRSMLAHRPLLDFLNSAGRPVLSIAGYGPNRPLRPNADEAGRSANRRIDLRFIMAAPVTSAEAAALKARLGAVGGGTP